MQPFIVCLHDVTPAFARETRAILRDLAPLVGRRVALGVVPNWHGQWHLSAYPDFCHLVREHSSELLLHGYFHQRRHGWGPVTWLAEGSDEMNGLDGDGTRRTLERGQQVFADVFGAPAQGFLAPAWQSGDVATLGTNTTGLRYGVGFFSVRSAEEDRVHLATWTWDCGRWGWLGHLGHGIGWLSRFVGRGVPTLAIHPRDLARGYWPAITDLVKRLLDTGHEPATLASLLPDRPAGPCHVLDCAIAPRALGSE